MARVLTGVQSTGVPHLGNIMGAILPAIEMANSPKNEAFLFIANYHSLTTIKDAELLKQNTYSVAATWLAFGFDTDKNLFYRQSDVPQVCELAWHLNCFMPYSRLQLAHSFKDKSENVSEVNTGLFTYPVLMAADILLYDAELVPVGKDQKQHLEFTRILAQKLNNQYGKGEENSILVVPEERISDTVAAVPGTDGRKMSKSYGNFIDILSTTDKQMRKQVMGIVTDSKELEESKAPDTCNVFKLYELMANVDQVTEMRKNYIKGGYGYGHAKQALFELLLERFGKEREQYKDFMENQDELEKQLRLGAEKAKDIASVTLERVRKSLGY